MTKRAIVYARVSTDDQAEKGFSLTAQIEAGRKYADLHGLTVTQELIDDGVSGAIPFWQRPAGATAWTLLQQGQAVALIAQDVDRLSRDVEDLLIMIRELLRVGVEVYCLDLGRITTEDDIMLYFKGWKGSQERQDIKRRCARGKRAKAAQGLVVCNGWPPFGYDWLRDDKGKIVNFTVNEEQAALVRLIFKWYLVGDDKSGPITQRHIAKRLRLAGIPTPQGKDASSTNWLPVTIAKIIGNRTYTGIWHYNSTDPETGEKKSYPVEVPALIDTATWEAAQVQKERNARKASRNAKREYLLTGIVKCGECGYTICGRARKYKGRETIYYQCSKRGRYPLYCTEKTTRADVLETAVWDTLLNTITDPIDFESKLREAQRQELEEQEPKRTELEAVKAMVAEAETEAITLADSLEALTATQKNGIVAKTLQDRIDALDERYNRLIARRDALEVALDNRRLTDEVITAALQFAADIKRGIDNPDNKSKREILDLFDMHLTLKGGIVDFDCLVPIPSIELGMLWRDKLCPDHPGRCRL